MYDKCVFAVEHWCPWLTDDDDKDACSNNDNKYNSEVVEKKERKETPRTTENKQTSHRQVCLPLSLDTCSNLVRVQTVFLRGAPVENKKL